MTAILQVWDLVVKGPLKAHIRNNRARKIVESFKNFKKENDENSMKPVVEWWRYNNIRSAEARNDGLYKWSHKFVWT